VGEPRKAWLILFEFALTLVTLWLVSPTRPALRPYALYQAMRACRAGESACHRAHERCFEAYRRAIED
jgi:hypothetical protein